MRKTDTEKAIVWGGSYHGRMIELIDGNAPTCVEFTSSDEEPEQYAKSVISLENATWAQDSFVYSPLYAQGGDVRFSTRGIRLAAYGMHCDGIDHAMRIAFLMNEEWMGISLSLLNAHKAMPVPTESARRCAIRDLRREQGFIRHLIEKLGHDPAKAYRISLKSASVSTVLH